MSKNISLCLITKNEEEFIERSINSAKEFVSEIIIVDTGSTDQTITKAEALGAKVFKFVWNNNFSAARNLAISKAQEEWILFLDADEVIEIPSKEEIDNLTSSSEIDGFYIIIKNLTAKDDALNEDMVVRLFRNHQNFYFTGAIHEQIAGSILAQGKKLGKSDLVIKHYGNDQEVVLRKKKNRRNMYIIKKELKTFPNDPFLNYSLAMEYYQLQRTEKGILCLEKAIKYLDGTESYYKDVVVRLILGFLHISKYQQAINYTALALLKKPDDADFKFLSALAYHECGNLLEALKEICNIGDCQEAQICPPVLNMPFMKNIIKLLFLQMEIYSECIKVGEYMISNFYSVENSVNNLFSYLLKGEHMQNGKQKGTYSISC